MICYRLLCGLYPRQAAEAKARCVYSIALMKEQGFSKVAESVKPCLMNASEARARGIAETVRRGSKRPELQLDNAQTIMEKPWMKESQSCIYCHPDIECV